MVLVLKKEGIFTSLQDLGRFGRQRVGIPPGGAMDRTSARIANLLVGNEESSPLLEFHFPAPVVAFEAPCIFALTGADFAARIDDAAVPQWSPNEAVGHGELHFPKRVSGHCAYLAVAGGLRIEPDHAGSRSSNRLTTGTRLILRRPAKAVAQPSGKRPTVSYMLRPPARPGPRVRFIPGGEHSLLTAASKKILSGDFFAVAANSNRMGYRLAGPSLELSVPSNELVSAAVTFGTMQLLPSGGIIILMGDHQVSGGYPRLGNIIAADLPAVAQLGVGDRIAFDACEIDDAEAALENLESQLRWLKTGVHLRRSPR